MRSPSSRGKASPAEEASRNATSFLAGKWLRPACRQNRSGRRRTRSGAGAADLAAPALEDGVGRGPFGHQNGGGTHAQGKGQRIAQPVGKKQLGSREAHITLGQTQHRRAVEFRRPVGVGMAVQRAFGLPGGARRIEPETRIIRAGVGALSQFSAAVDQRIKRARAGGRRALRARNDYAFDFVVALRQRRKKRGQQRPRDHHRLGAAVLEHVRVIIHREQRVDCHRHDASVHRTQETDRPVVAVVHQEQHALLAAHTRGQQRAGQAANALRQIAIAQAALVVDIGSLAGS